jgi:AcrR family transcriptional regulator
MAQRGYHHGNLRAALIEASFGLLAERGLPGFSVAQVARAVGVSTASPYRHFADRDALLAAVAAQAAEELADRMRADVAAAGPDPLERFAVTAGTYVRYVDARGAGFNVIFSSGLARQPDKAGSDAARRLIAELIALAQDAGGDGTGTDEALVLLERHIVAAHGYVTLFRDGHFIVGDPTVETIAERATEATRALLRGEVGR